MFSPCLRRFHNLLPTTKNTCNLVVELVAELTAGMSGSEKCFCLSLGNSEELTACLGVPHPLAQVSWDNLLGPDAFSPEG